MPQGGVFPAPYCAEGFSSNVEPITLVRFAGIDNTSGNVVGPPASQPAHQDFTTITGTVEIDTSYPITVKGNTDGNFNTAIMAYADWNQNGTFEAEERTQVGTILNSTGLDAIEAVGTIAVPATALPGETRLRISKKYTGTTPPTFPTPCNTAGFGQAEDYTLVVGGGGEEWNFDDVTAPALPAGFASTADGSGVPFITQTTLADTAPNAAYVVEQATVGNSYLDTPSFEVPASGGILTFRHAWNLEAGFDGAVLEISVAGGAFADIITAGGTFVAGGYNGTISTAWGSPIGGRAAWTNPAQATFATTEVELPPSAAGQNVVLRWRQANDSSVVATAPNGWWIDTIEVAAGTGPTEPSIEVTPTDLTFSVEVDAVDTDTLAIANVGGGTLNFTINEGTPAPAAAPHGYQSALRSRSGAQANIDIGDVDLAKAYSNPVTSAKAGAGVSRPMRGRDIPTGTRGTTIDISQMVSNAPEALNGVGCGSGTSATGSTAANSWWRRFYFDEHPGIGATAQINTVTIASESGPSLPVTVNVYTIPSSVAVDTIPTAQLTLIGTGTGTVGGNLTTTTVPITGGAVDDTVGKDLVVEYHVEGIAAPGGRLFQGGNPSAQTHATFLSAATCGITEPTNAAAVGGGFPDFHIIMVVNVGTGVPPTGCAAPGDVPWLSVNPANGSVAASSSTNATVSVDATGLTVGETYEALVCVGSNDAENPTVSVPVSLEVTAPCDTIFANGFDDGSNGACGGGAGPAVFTDRTAFLAAIGAGFYEEAFTSIPTQAVTTPMVFTSGGFSYSVFTQAGAVSGLYNDPGIVSTDNAGDQIVITFTTPVNAVGGNFWATDISVQPTGSPVVITLSDGTIETVTVSGSGTFRGFTTAAPITSLTIDAPEASPGVAPFFWATLDNLIVGSAN